MDEIEMRARELLAAEFERDGIDYLAGVLRLRGEQLTTAEARAVRAIAAALRSVEPAPAEGPRLPSGGSIESKAKAWDEVVNVMDEVCPDWISRSKVGAWAVCLAIREMAVPGSQGRHRP